MLRHRDDEEGGGLGSILHSVRLEVVEGERNRRGIHPVKGIR